MSTFIAALPMYDWPETRAATDAEWARFRALLPARRHRGAANHRPPQCRNAAVPGGIRDGEGRVIAPDPATLPPDELDFRDAVAASRTCCSAQTCWGPMELGLAEHVQVVGQPSYDGFEGGQGQLYSSAILMRRERGEACRPLPTARRSSRST